MRFPYIILDISISILPTVGKSSIDLEIISVLVSNSTSCH